MSALQNCQVSTSPPFFFTPLACIFYVVFFFILMFRCSFLSLSCSISFVQHKRDNAWVISGCFQCVKRDPQLNRFTVEFTYHLHPDIVFTHFVMETVVPYSWGMEMEQLASAKLQSAADSYLIYTRRSKEGHFILHNGKVNLGIRCSWKMRFGQNTRAKLYLWVMSFYVEGLEFLCISHSF